MRSDRDVGEGAIAVVMVKLGLLSFIRQSKVIRRHVTHAIGNGVTRDEEVLPAIIVVIEEKCGKTQDGTVDPGLRGHVAEMPLAGGVRPVVMEKDFRTGPAHG